MTPTERNREYRKTDKGGSVDLKYSRSLKGNATRKEYERSPGGKDVKRVYKDSCKGQIVTQRSNDLRRQNHRDIKDYIRQIKLERGCVDCGYKGHPDALEFDHVRGIKLMMVSSCRSAKEVDEEISKCEVRCANCHTVITAKRRVLKCLDK